MMCARCSDAGAKASGIYLQQGVGRPAGECHPVCNQSQLQAVVATQSGFALSDKLAPSSHSDCHFPSMGIHHLHYKALVLRTTHRHADTHALRVCPGKEPLSPTGLWTGQGLTTAGGGGGGAKTSPEGRGVEEGAALEVRRVITHPRWCS